MATDYTAVTAPWAVKAFALAGATANRVDLPPWCHRVSVYAETAVIQFASEGTDAAAGDSDYVPIAVGNMLSVVIGGKQGSRHPFSTTRRIFLTGAGATARIVMESE